MTTRSLGKKKKSSRFSFLPCACVRANASCSCGRSVGRSLSSALSHHFPRQVGLHDDPPGVASDQDQRLPVVGTVVEVRGHHVRDLDLPLLRQLVDRLLALEARVDLPLGRRDQLGDPVAGDQLLRVLEGRQHHVLDGRLGVRAGAQYVVGHLLLDLRVELLPVLGHHEGPGAARRDLHQGGLVGPVGDLHGHPLELDQVLGVLGGEHPDGRDDPKPLLRQDLDHRRSLVGVGVEDGHLLGGRVHLVLEAEVLLGGRPGEVVVPLDLEGPVVSRRKGLQSSEVALPPLLPHLPAVAPVELRALDHPRGFRGFLLMTEIVDLVHEALPSVRRLRHDAMCGSVVVVAADAAVSLDVSS
mmetsp:Transcript_20225/g.47522  ORF Transcript_20225/g.47522 Transcript_20225/m.47522 type:complete len:356 (+) Transcript_20225:710-1777(+)